MSKEVLCELGCLLGGDGLSSLGAAGDGELSH